MANPPLDGERMLAIVRGEGLLQLADKLEALQGRPRTRPRDSHEPPAASTGQGAKYGAKPARWEFEGTYDLSAALGALA